MCDEVRFFGASGSTKPAILRVRIEKMTTNQHLIEAHDEVTGKRKGRYGNANGLGKYQTEIWRACFLTLVVA